MQSLRALPRAASSIRAFSTSIPRPLAKMQIIGRLADQAEIVPTSTGREITRFALGVSSGPRDENGNRGVSWFRVASFIEGPQRDLLASLPKGTQLFIEADAKMDTYEAHDGTKRTQLNLLMRSFEALSRPQTRSATDAESDTNSEANPAQESLGGVGQS